MRPIARILTVLLAAFLVCSASYVWIEKGLSKYYDHNTPRLTEILRNNTYYDFLFIGSSRTHSIVNPRIIDSICKISSYNAGANGGNLLEVKMTWDAYLQNHPAPKLLVLTIDLRSFDLTRKFYNYPQYYPFLDNKVVDTTLSRNGHNTALLRMIPFLAVTDFDDLMRMGAIKGLTNKGRKQIDEGEFQYKGYLSNTQRVITAKTPKGRTARAGMDTQAIRYLEDIVNSCRKVHTSLVFTYAPEFQFELQKHTPNSRQVLGLVNGIAQANNIEFLRHDSLAICHDPKLFANNGHLNTPGATVYSAILAQQLLTKMR